MCVILYCTAGADSAHTHASSCIVIMYLSFIFILLSITTGVFAAPKQPSASAIFASFLSASSITPEQFFHSYFEREILHVKRNDEQFFTGRGEHALVDLGLTMDQLGII